MKQMDKIIIDKQVFILLQEVIGDIKCKYCKKKITKDNFGYISKDLNSCNDIVCLYDLIDEIEP